MAHCNFDFLRYTDTYLLTYLTYLLDGVQIPMGRAILRGRGGPL